jgi:hypothetical protein
MRMGGGVCRELVDGNYVDVIITTASCIYCMASPSCPLLHFGVELWSSRLKGGRVVGGEGVMDIGEGFSFSFFFLLLFLFSHNFFSFFLIFFHFQLNEEIK